MFKKIFTFIKRFFTGSPLVAKVLIQAAASRAFSGRTELASKAVQIIGYINIVNPINLDGLNSLILARIDKQNFTPEERAIIDILVGSVTDQIRTSIAKSHIADSDALKHAMEILGWIRETAASYSGRP